jgi:hypothetical protein
MARKKLKPQLTGIEGALSIYRVGDKVTFDIGSVEFDAPIEDYYIVNDQPYVDVTVAMRVAVSHIKKIVRAA